MKRLVVVVDDDMEIREAIADLLTEEGFESVMLKDGLEAESWFRSHYGTPCVLILDMLMPIMNGWQVLDHLRELNLLDNVKVMMVTASTVDDHESRGVEAVLRKPFHLETFVEKVNQLCAC